MEGQVYSGMVTHDGARIHRASRMLGIGQR